MPAHASAITRLLIAVVLLTHRWSASEGHHHHHHRYPQDYVREVDHAPKESDDDVLWIIGDSGHPVSRLQSSLLERILYNRNKLTNQMKKKGQLDSDTNERDSLSSTEDKQQSPIIPQTTSQRAFAKRGIGLISLAVALAQNNASYSKPRMQPVDLSAYPRRARFFIATMG